MRIKESKIKRDILYFNLTFFYIKYQNIRLKYKISRTVVKNKQYK